MAESDEFLTRDLSTLPENGPNLMQMESPVARADATAAYRQRPVYSPVAQPGMNPEIWYHTVPSPWQAQSGSVNAPGATGRGQRPGRQRIIIRLGRRRRGGRHAGK